MPKKLSKYVVSVDCVLFAYRDKKFYIPLLLRNSTSPHFPNAWSLPGGPISDQEDPEQACTRKLKEDFGLKIHHLEQLYTFGDPSRDPRIRAFSIAHFALVSFPTKELKCGPDYVTAQWFELSKIPESPWAFDHHLILQTAINRIKSKIQYEPIGISILPHEFSLADLKYIYDAILNTSLDRRNFYKKIKKSDLLIPTRTIPSKRGKPTQLYKFDKSKYNKLKATGYNFEI